MNRILDNVRTLFTRLKSDKAARAMELTERLLRDRIVFLGTPIDDQIANLIIGQLLFLRDQDKTRDISLYINSPGGAITSSMALFDVIRGLGPDVTTICLGRAAGCAALLVAGGARAKRFATPSALFELVPFEIAARGPHAPAMLTELDRCRSIVLSAFADATGKPTAQIAKDSTTGLQLDAAGAIEYGLIDAIVAPPST